MASFSGKHSHHLVSIQIPPPPKMLQIRGQLSSTNTQQKASCCRHLITFRLFSWTRLLHFIFLLQLKSDPFLSPIPFQRSV